MADAVTEALIRRLTDSDLRRQVIERREAMLRELRYLVEREDTSIIQLQRAGWTIERFEVVCGLNAFYQLVLGPLSSSARGGLRAGRRMIPVLYGEQLRFDEERQRRLRAAHQAFFAALPQLQAPRLVLTAPHFADLVTVLLAGEKTKPSRETADGEFDVF